MANEITLSVDGKVTHKVLPIAEYDALIKKCNSSTNGVVPVTANPNDEAPYWKGGGGQKKEKQKNVVKNHLNIINNFIQV